MVISGRLCEEALWLKHNICKMNCKFHLPSQLYLFLNPHKCWHTERWGRRRVEQRWCLIFEAQSTTKGHNRETEGVGGGRRHRKGDRKTDKERHREKNGERWRGIHELWRTKRPGCDTHSRTLDELEPMELVLGSTYHDDVSAYRLHGVAIQYHRLQRGDSTQWVRQPVRRHVCKKLHVLWNLSFRI